MKVLIAFIILLSINPSFTVFAVEKTRGLATDNRIKVVSYDPENVVPIFSATFIATQIIFSKGEVIEDIQNGDLDAWTVNVEKNLPNMLFIKPTVLGSDTNMTVITNIRTYYFHLQSNKDPAVSQTKITYAIKFIYPEETKAATLQNLKYNLSRAQTLHVIHRHSPNLNWDYSFSGDKAIAPVKIFDDGKFTFMQFKENQSIPAIFSVDNKAGEEATVNYRREGKYIVIQALAPQFTLRNGKYSVASIFNNRLIRELRGENG